MRPSVPFAPFDQFLSAIHQAKTTYLYIRIETLLDQWFRYRITHIDLAHIDPFQVTAGTGEIEMRGGTQPQIRTIIVITVLYQGRSRPDRQILVLELGGADDGMHLGAEIEYDQLLDRRFLFPRHLVLIALQGRPGFRKG